MSQALLQQIIRVNQAGEYGAKYIYIGQLSVLRLRAQILPSLTVSQTCAKIQHMYKQELRHLEYFNSMVQKHRVRPTMFQPVWHVGAMTLGVVSAIMGVETAMACTVAVEEVIDSHYASQIKALEQLPESDLYSNLIKQIAKFRDEEIQHKNAAAEGGHSFRNRLFIFGVRAITRCAIEVAKRF